MMRRSLRVCPDVREPQWGLGALPPSRGRVALIGWSQLPDQPDAGVPDDVAGLLARALTSAARISSLASGQGVAPTGLWLPCDGNLVRAFPRPLATRFIARWRGDPVRLALLSTLRPESVRRMLDDPAFPWWMQGQVLLLSAPGAPPPVVDEGALLALLGDRWTEEAPRLATAGVAAILRPGVDGDVAGLLAQGDAFERQILGALEHEARLAGVDYEVLPEEALR